MKRPRFLLVELNPHTGTHRLFPGVPPQPMETLWHVAQLLKPIYPTVALKVHDDTPKGE